jgi:hypothetical protein
MEQTAQPLVLRRSAEVAVVEAQATLIQETGEGPAVVVEALRVLEQEEPPEQELWAKAKTVAKAEIMTPTTRAPAVVELLEQGKMDKIPEGITQKERRLMAASEDSTLFCLLFLAVAVVVALPIKREALAGTD